MTTTLPTPETQPAPAPLWFIDDLAVVHLDGEQTGGAYGLTEMWGRRGDMPPLHVHRAEDEMFYVLEGEMSLYVGDRHLVVPAGRAAFAPRDVPHTYRIESETARWLALGNPAGFERFVRAVAEPAPAREIPPAGRTHAPAVLAQLAAAHGIELLGPPGALPAGHPAT
jgi:quercetin dioxygenase-like cupin family protein